MKIQNNILKGLSKKEDIYQFKVGEMFVEMTYSEDNKSFNECMLNILKTKMKQRADILL